VIGGERRLEYAVKAPVRVELYTRNYHVSGDIELNRWRLADALNDNARPSVLLEHAVREPLPKLAQEAGADLARASQFLQIAKDSVVFAVPHEAPELGGARQQYLSSLQAEEAENSVSIVTPPFEIQGIFHRRRAVQLRQAHEELPSEFLALTQVEAVYLYDRRLRVSADLAVVNRAIAELFAISGEGPAGRRFAR
jgi:hypothetical protein